jgi:hypothetical protein
MDMYGELLQDSLNILNTWNNYFCQLLNVHGVNDVRQTEIYTAQLLVLEPSSFDIEIALHKLKRSKLTDTDQILAELVQALRSTNLLNLFRIATAVRGTCYCA